MATRDSNTSVPAVAYLRKSTTGTNADGRERQERSIPQQTAEVAKLKPQDGGHYTVNRTYADPGKSGWKRGAARPDFTRMLADCQRHRDVRAILVDDLDRFSRATVGEVWSDIQALKSAGVQFIHACNQGCYNLGDSSDIGTILKLTVEIWSANEFSRKLGRRVALARRNAAQAGKRTGAKPPFGYVSDGNKGLVLGEPEHVEIVRQMFDLFVRHHLSIQGVANHFNRNGIPSPRGKAWRCEVVRQMLQQRAYLGELVFGSVVTGRFYRNRPDGSVEEATQLRGERNEKPAVVIKDHHPAIIDRALFAAAQKRLAGFKTMRRPKSARPYALSRIIRCSHCGAWLIGAQVRKNVYYKCPTNLRARGKKCDQFTIREDLILPFLIHRLDSEMAQLVAESLLPKPLPAAPAKDHDRAITSLDQKIAKYVRNILDIEDADTRKELDRTISELRGERAALVAEKAAPPTEDDAKTASRLAEWWSGKRQEFLSATLDAGSPIAKTAFPELAALAAQPAPWDAWAEALCGGKRPTVFVAQLDVRGLNEALHGLGCEVSLRWRIESRNKRKRFFVEKGRYRLGQQTGEISPSISSGFA